MQYTNTSASDWAVARKAEQAAAHDQRSLRRLARGVLSALPPGPCTLVTTSAEGAALAGAVAMLRQAPTEWYVINLSGRIQLDGPLAVVETVRLGEGVRRALVRRFPQAIFVDGHVGEHEIRAA